MKPARTLDLTTETCPMTFLYTKLAFEQLAEGDRLEVRFGQAESAGNVRRALAELPDATLEDSTEAEALVLKVQRIAMTEGGR